jgi:hypothetical protein
MTSLRIALVLCLLGLMTQLGHPQIKRTKYALTKFNNEGCMAKGRVQDCSDSVVMRQILADGNDAIPTLILQLTERTPTETEIADYWFGTESGDVAYIVLTDLFTMPNEEKSQMPNVVDWTTLRKGCNNTAQSCWELYLRKHGRASVQRAWLRAWNLHKDQIYWDSKARCFRVSEH